MKRYSDISLKGLKKIAISLLPYIFRYKKFKRFRIDFKSKDVDQEFEVLPLILNPQSVVLDIGANLGEYTYFFQEIIQVKEVIAFEPIPELFNNLKILFPKIQVYPFAVSSHASVRDLFIPYIDSIKYETRAKLDLLPEINETKNESIRVQTIALDSFFDASTSKIDFIKIDIEGHELHAIRGAEKIILRDYPILMVEIEHRHHPQEFHAVIDEICNLGYKCTFYDKSQKSLLEFRQFSLEKHQNLELKENYYIHNFLFFPFNYSIESLNNSIHSSL